MLGKTIYIIMVVLSVRILRKVFWKALRVAGIDNLLDDVSFWKIITLVYAGEKYQSPKEGGGGVYSVINWQRINWKSDLPRLCADKISVRDYVRERIGEKYLIKRLPREDVSWSCGEEINFGELPNEFVLKLNNGSRMNLIVTNKEDLNLDEARSKIDSWINSKFESFVRENQYKEIKNKVYCEELLRNPDGSSINDFKIMCSNGKVLFIWVDVDRFNGHQRSVYDTNFTLQNVTIGHPKIKKMIQKPKNWDLMLKIASKLSKGIPIVRIDLYNIDGRVYFGEMTFTSEACSVPYNPMSFSRLMAKKIDLSTFTKEWK